MQFPYASEASISSFLLWCYLTIGVLQCCASYFQTVIQFVLRVEAKAQEMEPAAQSIAIFLMETAYAVTFAHKGKSNTSFGTIKGLLLFVCTHNINKTLCFYLEQERFAKMNLKTANTCLTDMINISIESFKLLLNEINKNKNKNSLI